MPTFNFTSPEGKKYSIEGPEGATQEQAFQILQTQLAKPADPIDEGARNFANDSGPGTRFLEGAGKAITDVGRGIGQMVGVVDRAGVAESRRLDAPLMATGFAANAGNVAGNLATMAPASLAGGMSIPVAAGIGAGVGLLQPSTSTGETVTNTLLGGAGGAAGQKVANMMGGLATRGVNNAAAQNAANSQKMLAARNGSALGYVVPPDDLNSGLITQAVSGLSGKIKTAQEASARNQNVTNSMARKALGLNAGQELTEDVLQNIRKQAGNSYAAVRGVGAIVPDQQYMQALDTLAATSQGASRSFPGLPKNGIEDIVVAMKQPSFDAADAIDATIVLREMADKSYRAGDKAVGKAQKAIANELEDAIERSISTTAAPDAIKNFKAARQEIAKTYSVQKALNSQTGNVSAIELAKQLQRGKPLSGELKQIAEFGQAFPKAAQALAETPKSTSPLDWVAGVGASVGTGNPLPLAMIGARPIARNALLSGPVQRNALQNVAPSRVGQIANSEINRLLARPLGIQGGLAAEEFVRQ